MSSVRSVCLRTTANTDTRTIQHTMAAHVYVHGCKLNSRSGGRLGEVA